MGLLRNEADDGNITASTRKGNLTTYCEEQSGVPAHPPCAILRTEESNDDCYWLVVR